MTYACCMHNFFPNNVHTEGWKTRANHGLVLTLENF
jgi:hypothetical protein